MPAYFKMGIPKFAMSDICHFFCVDGAMFAG